MVDVVHVGVITFDVAILALVLYVCLVFYVKCMINVALDTMHMFSALW